MTVANAFGNVLTSLFFVQTIIAEPQLKYQEFGSTDWVARTQPIGSGNGVFLSPDEKMVLTSTMPAIVHAFDAEDGVKVWSYNPSMSSWTGDSLISCLSGLTFANTGSLEYVVYAVNIEDRFLSLNPKT
eukprot:scaffold25699_cov137-Cylindrotheca_fusiformis.AAC.7